MTAQEIVQIITASAFIQCMCDTVAHFLIYQNDAYHDQLDQLAFSKSKLVAAQSKLKATISSDDVRGDTSTNNTSNNNNNNNKKGSVNHEKQQQMVQRLEQEYSTKLSRIAMIHFRPSMASAVLFFLLMWTFGTEHKGKIIGVLPFVPYKFIQRLLSLRGLRIDPQWLSALSPTNDDTNHESSILQELLSRVNNTSYSTSRTANGVVNGITSIGQVCSFTIIYMLTTMSVKYYMQQLFGTVPPKGAESYISAIADSPKVQEMVKTSTGLDPKDYKTD